MTMVFLVWFGLSDAYQKYDVSGAGFLPRAVRVPSPLMPAEPPLADPPLNHWVVEKAEWLENIRLVKGLFKRVWTGILCARLT